MNNKTYFIIDVSYRKYVIEIFTSITFIIFMRCQPHVASATPALYYSKTLGFECAAQRSNNLA